MHIILVLIRAPIHDIGTKHFALFVELAVVEVDDAQVLAQGLLPAGRFVEFPFECIALFVNGRVGLG